MAVQQINTTPYFRASSTLITILVWFLLTVSFSHAAQRDVDCLRSLTESLQDPNNSLNTWDFSNTTEGSICRFTGVDCWHPDENKVLNIRLVDMGLRGEFPLGLSGCSSMTGLDLSSNHISGQIPNNISKVVGYLTSLDLSNNRFSGEIPADLANCTYLNILKLDHNQLTGPIPYQIGNLNRLRTITVTNNHLSGPIPHFVNSTIQADSFANNPGLCGEPLPPCGGPSVKHRTPIVIGAAVGGVTVGALVFAVGMFFFLRRVARKKKEEDLLGNKWAKSIKGTKRIKVRYTYAI
ncbi:hypothetical protein RD792_002953 [Penstemon davidsonii]|uniref:Leucine-rich repeat-containing N-terminal plant-type domain-containing protein n=1 Tax=Penstemon davidsonii TaxID=160366 RepID=A0ABR0DT40_9LAMI|nr:hypothetical protein RD792_002953 [Penstemon davidsonii]